MGGALWHVYGNQCISAALNLSNRGDDLIPGHKHTTISHPQTTMNLLAGTLRMMQEDKDLKLEGILPLEGLTEANLFYKLASPVATEKMEEIHQSVTHIFSDSVLCLGKALCMMPHILYNKNKKKRYTANRDYYKTDFSMSIIGEPLEIEWHVHPGATCEQLVDLRVGASEANSWPCPPAGHAGNDAASQTR